jgi:hypothetical protein
MGLSLEFYAGDAQVIGEAFTDVDLDDLRDGKLAHSYADFSLHIPLEDLDILSEQIGTLTGGPVILFLDSLGEIVGGTDGESSAQVVDDRWVQYVASVPLELTNKLTADWLKAASEKVGEDYGDGSDGAASALLDLVMLCRSAIAQKSTVVFAWYL